MKDRIAYEFPLNERIRVFMRLEQLFHQVDHFMEGATVWDSRIVIITLLEILAIFSRNDLKSETLKELDRHASFLQKLSHHDGLDNRKLESALVKIQIISDELYRSNGKIGLPLLGNELFKSISQRSSIPGGTCCFDLPAYHYWLQQSEAQRRADLNAWLKPFEAIRSGIGLSLDFIRGSAAPTEEIAQGGFFQQTLDHALPFQLLRVTVPADQTHFAEISGGKHRFTVRFMTFAAAERPVQTQVDIPFELTCCLL